jgi:hypothetical protein
VSYLTCCRGSAAGIRASLFLERYLAQPSVPDGLEDRYERFGRDLDPPPRRRTPPGWFAWCDGPRPNWR